MPHWCEWSIDSLPKKSLDRQLDFHIYHYFVNAWLLFCSIIISLFLLKARKQKQSSLQLNMNYFGIFHIITIWQSKCVSQFHRRTDWILNDSKRFRDCLSVLLKIKSLIYSIILIARPDSVYNCSGQSCFLTRADRSTAAKRMLHSSVPPFSKQNVRASWNFMLNWKESPALLMPRIPVIQISKNKNCWMVTWDNVGPEKCN